VAKETSNSESLSCIEECLRKKYEQDMEYYKEQICRQEATIAAHQERLGRVLRASRRASAKPCQQQGIDWSSRMQLVGGGTDMTQFLERSDNVISLVL